MTDLDIHPASPYATASPLPEVYDGLNQPTQPISMALLAELLRRDLEVPEQYEDVPTVALRRPGCLDREPRSFPPLAWVALVIAVATAIAIAVVGLPGQSIPPPGCRVDVCAGVDHG